MPALWDLAPCNDWHEALDGYPSTVAAFGSARLAELDRWRRLDLPSRVDERLTPSVTLDELVRLTEWKMLRGVWRANNLQLVRGNASTEVERLSGEALAAIPDPKRPVALLSRLAGVGPATASAVLSMVAPADYPFFDEVVAVQIPSLGPVAFTAAYYQRYADALRERAASLAAACPHGVWPVHSLDLALWAAVEGTKAHTRGRKQE